jgi:hypothetical protein
MATHTNRKTWNRTGSGVISETFSPDVAFMVEAVKLHLASPTGSGSGSGSGSLQTTNFSVTVDSAEGAAYDVVLLSQDMSSSTDLAWVPDQPIFCAKGDELEISWENDSGYTWGVELVYREEV